MLSKSDSMHDLLPPAAFSLIGCHYDQFPVYVRSHNVSFSRSYLIAYVPLLCTWAKMACLYSFLLLFLEQILFMKQGVNSGFSWEECLMSA